MDKELTRTRECDICGTSFTLADHGDAGERAATPLSGCASNSVQPGDWMCGAAVNKCPECRRAWVAGRIDEMIEEVKNTPRWRLTLERIVNRVFYEPWAGYRMSMPAYVAIVSLVVAGVLLSGYYSTGEFPGTIEILTLSACSAVFGWLLWRPHE